MKTSDKNSHRIRRKLRIRSKISGTAKVPRVSIFRSNRNLFVQMIDDVAGKTLLSGGVSPKGKSVGKVKKVDSAMKIGEILGQKAKDLGIKKVVFDRGGYKYHGRVKSLADGLRKSGLEF